MPFNLDASFILIAEQVLGAALPVSYKAAMQTSNGGELDALGDIWQLYPIADTSDRKRIARTANHIIKETGLALEWSAFPVHALAIANNGTGDQLVFLREGDSYSEAVYHWCHETGVLDIVANDFAELERF